MTTEVKLFDITDLAIQELNERCGGLTISGIDDKEGYKAVKAARIVIKGYRVDIDKRRKELNEDALKHQRFINGEAKRITERLAEIEYYLASQEKQIDDAIDAIKAEEYRQQEVKKQARIDALVECGFRFNGNMFTSVNKTGILPISAVIDMSDEIFNRMIALEMAEKAEDDRKRAEFQAEQERKAAEAKAEADRVAAEQRKAAEELATERAKLAAEWAEQEAKAKALAEQERAIKAESERLDNEKKCKEASEALDKFAPRKPKLVSIPDFAEVEKPAPTSEEKECAFPIVVSISGTFKARGLFTAKSYDQAKQIAIAELNDFDEWPSLIVDFEVEQIHCKDE